MLDANKYQVLSFDCYGTLVDWESGIIAGLRPVLRVHNVEATDAEILDLHAQTEHKLQAASKRGGYVKYRDVLGEEVREAGRRWGFEPSPSEVEALPDSVRYWLPFPDTVHALRTLKGRYRLAIISNIDDGLFALMIFPAKIIFARSRVSSSVTRRPLITVCSTPILSANSFNCFPPP